MPPPASSPGTCASPWVSQQYLALPEYCSLLNLYPCRLSPIVSFATERPVQCGVLRNRVTVQNKTHGRPTRWGGDALCTKRVLNRVAWRLAVWSSESHVTDIVESITESALVGSSTQQGDGSMPRPISSDIIAGPMAEDALPASALHAALSCAQAPKPLAAGAGAATVL